MKKRVLSLFTAVMILFLSLNIRLLDIGTGKTVASSEQNSVRSRILSTTRGRIYDRNLLPLVNNREKYIACIVPTPKALISVKQVKNAEEITAELEKKTLVSAEVMSPALFSDNDDICVVTAFDRYKDATASHLLGYLDSDGNGAAGLERYYDSFLSANSGSLSAVFHTDALGRILIGEGVEIRNDNYDTAAGIVLTIDKSIQTIAENVLKNGNIEKGCAVVTDVNTGAILAAASVPEFDRNNLKKSLKDKNSPFINRAFCAYNVGSVFKLITAAAALENNLGDFCTECTGSVTKSGNKFFCSKRDGHGNQSLDDALSNSCNVYFIELSVMLGGDALINTAKNLGFAKEIDLGNGFVTDSGVLPEIESLNSDAAVGNFGFGQGYLTATPLQLAAAFSAIANGGTYNKPHLIKGTVDESGKFTAEKSVTGNKVLSANICERLKRAMNSVTESGTGKNAATSLFKVCGKTATAENGDGTVTTWFSGFFPYENPMYEITVLKENGTSGSLDDAPVFKEIAENIYIMEKANY